MLFLSRRVEMSELDQLIEDSHSAVDAFVRGDPEPLKDLYSRSDGVDHRQPFRTAG